MIPTQGLIARQFCHGKERTANKVKKTGEINN
jgi:hypothetical protein